MRRARLIHVMTAAIIAAGSIGAAFAGTGGKGDDASEMRAALSAKVTAAEAITTAEQKTGGHALKVGLEDENGRVFYAVGTVAQDKVLDVFVDPDSGAVVRSEEQGLIHRIFNREDKAGAADLMKSPTSLSAAIAAAEQQTGGKVIEAAYGDEGGRGIFEIDVIRNNARFEVKVDGATGKVLKVPSGEGGAGHER